MQFFSEDITVSLVLVKSTKQHVLIIRDFIVIQVPGLKIHFYS